MNLVARFWAWLRSFDDGKCPRCGQCVYCKEWHDGRCEVFK